MNRVQDLYRPIETIRAKKVKDVKPERAIRLYCEQADSIWNLQIRTPLSRAAYGDGKDFIVSTAPLSKEDMKALRDSIDDFLKEFEEFET